MQYSATPAPQGLYDPSFERDACGVAAVADIRGRRSHSIVADGVTALINLDHRGAAGADPAVGDGAGILIQVPDRLLRDVAGFPLPTSVDPRHGEAYAVGVAFLPPEEDLRAQAKEIVEGILAEEGLELLGWRLVPTDPVGSGVGQMAVDVMPAFEQLFVAGPARDSGRHPAVRHRPGPDDLPGAQADRARDRRRARRGARRLPGLAVQPHHRLQGHADHRRSCRRSSPT